MKVILFLSLLIAFNCITMRNLFAVRRIYMTPNATITETETEEENNDDVPDTNHSQNSTNDSNDDTDDTDDTEEKPEEIVIEIKPSIIWSKQPLMKKPVIYLYPEEPMDVSVQLDLKYSKFTTIYPRFNGKQTWKVHAEPNGELTIKDKKYPYLFWEAQSYKSQETNEGFIVTDENAEAFLEEKLKILGLNEKEATDFITFWLPVLLKNKLSLCSFQTEKFFKDIELNITPKPDSLIRVFLTIKKLDEVVNVKEQNLKAVERTGFIVVEWGGSNF